MIDRSDASSGYSRSVQLLPRTWLGRSLAVLIAAGLVLVGVFFFVLFLVTAGIVTAALALRLLWIHRRLKREPAQSVLEGEYTVERSPDGPAEGPAALSEHSDRPKNHD